MNKTIFRAALPPLLALLALWAPSAHAEKRNFELAIDTVNITVNPALKFTVFAFDGQVPGPLIHVKEGDEVTLKVTNRTGLPHSIHWHGIYNTWQNDGVPLVTQEDIRPGESFTYTFIANPTGSLWYHCHVNVHEHVAYRGMWAPLIVDPKNPTDLEKKVTKDFIMMLSAYDSEWKDKPGFGGHPKDVANYFAINARTFPYTQPLRVKKGDFVRIRFYGAGGETHNIHTHGHSFLVTHKDGNPLPVPYTADTISVSPGERYDIMFEANNPGRWAIHDHVDHHVTDDGKYPGGVITILEYDEVQKSDPWYAWKDVAYDGNFYYQESLTRGYGMWGHAKFRGEYPQQRRRGGQQ